jgi:hypothetical protein
MDIYTEFPCLILACGISGRYATMTFIKDLETGDQGWCSSHLVDES